MVYHHKNKGTCSRETTVVIEDGILREVRILGGCDGNIKGIISLVTGMNAAEAAERLRGIRCGFKSTSCPDQLARAIDEALASEAE